jgi:hypothetical protein
MHKLTKNRDQCGCNKYKKGDTTKTYDPVTKKMITKKFVKEQVHTDKDGNITGVSTTWQ